jgi:rubrerythrin
MKFKSIDEAIDFAIKNEVKAYELYRDLAEKASGTGPKAIFEGFAEEELGHKNKLMEIKKSHDLSSLTPAVVDLKIADYTIDIVASKDMSYQDALLFAMKAEKAAFKLYSKLAENATDSDIKDLFQHLAMEESKHKLRFEIEYDDHILTEN